MGEGWGRGGTLRGGSCHPHPVLPPSRGKERTNRANKSRIQWLARARELIRAYNVEGSVGPNSFGPCVAPMPSEAPRANRESAAPLFSIDVPASSYAQARARSSP